MRGNLRQLRAVALAASALVGLVTTKRAKGKAAQRVSLAALALVVLVPAGAAAQSDAGASSEWPYFGGTRAFTRYAPLDQIDRSNVTGLRVAWRRPAVDASFTGAFPELEPSGYLRSTPILVDGVLYASNAVGLVEAFDPATGETRWLQRPRVLTLAGVAGRGAHGVAFWSDGADRRIFAFRNRFLYALDADTGEPIAGFGDGGRVDLTPEGARSAHGGASPIVVGDVVVAAGTVDGAGDSGARWRGSAPENVRGYDARTGALRWTFHVVPRPGEFGADTWGAGSLEASGDLGAWCCLSADPELGTVYVPLTAPTAAYYGGHRPGDNLFSNSLVALDAATGERVWHFQMVHHDLWEYDTVGPPTLGEITVDDRRIRAVMQPSKTGFLYVFDRVTGEPVWPIEERPVPPSTVPGEHAVADAAVPDPSPAVRPPGRRRGRPHRLHVRPGGARPRGRRPLRSRPPVHPAVRSSSAGRAAPTAPSPSPARGGRATGTPARSTPGRGSTTPSPTSCRAVYRLADASGEENAEMTYYSPNRDAPYLDGIPLVKPPWGRITAVDLNRGALAWRVANGRGLRDHPALRGLDLPRLGIASRPVALVTATLPLPRRGRQRLRRHPGQHVGDGLPRLRQGHGRGGVGDGASGGDDRRADDLPARGPAVHRRPRRRARPARRVGWRWLFPDGQGVGCQPVVVEHLLQQVVVGAQRFQHPAYRDRAQVGQRRGTGRSPAGGTPSCRCMPSGQSPLRPARRTGNALWARRRSGDASLCFWRVTPACGWRGSPARPRVERRPTGSFPCVRPTASGSARR